MEALVCLVVMLAIIGGSDAAFCVCRSDVSDSALQKALDYACGAGADCNPILQNGACYGPNTVRSHCSYAVNSYYQRKQQTQQACDFAGAATLTSTDPSSSGCTYPATPSAAGTGTTPSTTTSPGSATPGSTTTTPNTFTPSTGTGGVLGGLGPSGNGISTDTSDGAAFFLPRGFLPAVMLSTLAMFLMY